MQRRMWVAMRWNCSCRKSRLVRVMSTPSRTRTAAWGGGGGQKSGIGAPQQPHPTRPPTPVSATCPPAPQAPPSPALPPIPMPPLGQGKQQGSGGNAHKAFTDVVFQPTDEVVGGCLGLERRRWLEEGQGGCRLEVRGTTAGGAGGCGSRVRGSGRAGERAQIRRGSHKARKTKGSEHSTQGAVGWE